jgi:chloramphenicol-sensitive protein RarD
VADERRGTLYGVLAYLCWGLFPLYWPLLEPADALEILGHRVVWSLVFVVAVLAARRQWAWVRDYVTDRRRMGLLSTAAVVIAVNWGVYIWGVNHDHVVETSLGYFINPLVTVLLGVLVLGERLRRLQWVATGIAALAVIGLAVDYGRPPWIALTLAVSFGSYGLLKKKANAGAVESLTIETTVLLIPALVYLAVISLQGTNDFGHDGSRTLLLAGTGVITAIPLLFFGASATRVPLSTLGLLQYLAPTLQFLLGVVVYGEPLPLGRLLGFIAVWTALGVFSYDALTAHHRRHTALEPAAIG